MSTYLIKAIVDGRVVGSTIVSFDGDGVPVALLDAELRLINSVVRTEIEEVSESEELAWKFTE